VLSSSASPDRQLAECATVCIVCWCWVPFGSPDQTIQLMRTFADQDYRRGASIGVRTKIPRTSQGNGGPKAPRLAILNDTGWNRQPTPFEWGGQRKARREEA
jgi:hypothetical protein